MNILVTNDDGINSEGLRVLSKAMSELGEVFVVAPDRERSAVGLSITLERPLRVTKLDERAFSVDGMPVDCVELAIYRLMGSPPDFIISGINNGQNVGYDVFHSGTVGAAITGAMFGIPSMAVSIATSGPQGDRRDVVWYDSAAQIALKLSRAIMEHSLPRGLALNVNVPNLPLSELKGIEITRNCSATYDIEVHHRVDPRGREYYWLGGAFQRCDDRLGTDVSALFLRKVSVTPLRLDLTDYQAMEVLSGWMTDSITP